MSAVIPVQEPIFAFTAGLTFYEYLQTLDRAHRKFLRERHTLLYIDPQIQSQLTTYPVWLYLVLLVSDDTPDTMMVLPIIQRMAEISPRLDLRIVTDEADLSALNDLVDDEIDLEEDLADLDLPQLFIFDEEWNQQAQWGPRPAAAEDRLEQWLATHPDYEKLLAEENSEDMEKLESLMNELTDQMRLWYNDDLNRACMAEISTLLQQLQENKEE
jgi:DNA-binding transcriptional LysR family regulator